MTMISLKRHCFTYLFIGFVKLIPSCNNPNQLKSDDYYKKSEKIKLLKEEINCFSDFYDAEFNLINANGFHNQRSIVAGATSLNYKFAIRVKKPDIVKWTIGFNEIPYNTTHKEWIKEISKQIKHNWKTYSKGRTFSRKEIESDVTVLVFEKEGIIFKRIITY